MKKVLPYLLSARTELMPSAPVRFGVYTLHTWIEFLLLGFISRTRTSVKEKVKEPLLDSE